MPPAWGLVLLAAVSIRIEDAAGVDPLLAKEIAEQVAAAVEARALAEAASGRQGDANEEVVLVFDPGAMRLQVSAARRRGGAVIAKGVVIGPLDPRGWADPASALAASLYPMESAGGAGEAPRATWLARALLGAGVASAAAAVVFAASSAGARSELGSRLVFEPELSSLDGRATAHGAAAIALSGLGAALVVTGVVLLGETR